MATTTNYSWTTPDDTDLVKDGAAAIRTLGSSADTTVKNLNPGTTAGDIDYYTSSTAKARVAIGTAGQVLKVNSGGTAPEWGAAADQTPLTTKGDLFTFDTADARLPVGTDGFTLVADSVETTGLKWVAPSAPAPNWALLSTTNTTAGGSISITGLSGYNQLLININAVTTVGATSFNYTLNNITTNNYESVRTIFPVTGGVLGSGSSAGAIGFINGGAVPLAVALSGSFIINGANSSGFKSFTGQSGGNSTTNGNFIIFSQGIFSEAAVISSFEINAASSTFNGGDIKIYGSVN